MIDMKFLQVPAMFNTVMLDVVWIIVGLIAFYAGIKNLLDKENPSRIGTAIFWCSFGVVTALGSWLPPKVSGALVIVMCMPAIFKKVKVGRVNAPTKEYTKAQYSKIGMKIFVPALTVAVMSLFFALFSNVSSMVGITIGVAISMVLLMVYSRDNKPKVFLDDSERFLSLMGPLCMLPQLLGCLGGVFTAAGVGDVVAGLVGNVVPEGNVNLGIGGPFVLAYGANPVVIGMLALTCGFCGTLCTPMAANFNIVPVAILDMKDRWGVIKNQVLVAIIMITIQICFMIAFK